MFIIAGVHWLFLIPSALFFAIAFLVFRDIKDINEDEDKEDNVQEVVNDNLEEKQINQEVKMEKTNEEKTLLLEVLSKDEELNAFLKVTNGQAKFALFEKLRTELEAKPKKEEPKAEPEKPKEELKEDDEIVVEE